MSSTPNIGVVGRPGGWSTELLSSELASRGAGGEVLELETICEQLDTGKFDRSFDGLIIKKPGRYSARLLALLDQLSVLEHQGVRLISSPAALKQVVDRTVCTRQLLANGIPMPPTLMTEVLADALDWLDQNGPAVLKPVFGTKAKGMSVVRDSAELQAALAASRVERNNIIYLQKKLTLPGADYCLVFLAGKFLGAYARVSDGSTWHTSTISGARYEPFQPDNDMIDLATRAAKVFDLDFASVDVADTNEQGRIVFEVSAFGAFKGLKDAANISAASRLAEYAIERCGLTVS